MDAGARHGKAMARVVVLALAWATVTVRAQMAPLLLHETQDAACAQAHHTPIEPEWVDELRGLLPQANALWQAQAPLLFAAVARLTQGAVVPRAVPVRLTLCGVPSQSTPEVLVNMRYALRSFTPEPVPLRVKIDTAFHETLHRSLAGLDPARSALLTQHASEPPCVRNHLHLLALQKAVLLDLGQAQELAQVIRTDGQLPSGCYRRAWSLVNAAPDTYHAYVAELSAGR